MPADQARARADRGARAGMTGRAADDGAQRRAAQRAADRAVGLCVAGGLARRHIAGARRGVAAAEQITLLRILGRTLRIGAGRRALLVAALGRAGRRAHVGTGQLCRRRVGRIGGLGKSRGAHQCQRQCSQGGCTNHCIAS